jgi:hypothetical protein
MTQRNAVALWCRRVVQIYSGSAWDATLTLMRIVAIAALTLGLVAACGYRSEERLAVSNLP